MQLFGERPGDASRQTEEQALPLIRGTMHRAIVLKAPDDTFSQAVFILNDSFLQREGVSRRELLRQAGEAAGLYCPPRRKKFAALAPAAVFLLGAASAILVLLAAGLL